jgi:hypothetical protein
MACHASVPSKWREMDSLPATSAARSAHVCPYCFAKKFANRRDLDDHIAKARHGDWEPRCAFCNKHFQCYDSLRAHLDVEAANSKARARSSALRFMSRQQSSARWRVPTGTKKSVVCYASLHLSRQPRLKNTYSNADSSLSLAVSDAPLSRWAVSCTARLSEGVMVGATGRDGCD